MEDHRGSSRGGRQSFLYGTTVLAAAIVAVKILGALFKIPLAGIIGTEGYGHYFIAYNIYCLLLSISTGGLPVALSKMIAEANAEKRYNQARKTARIALKILFTAGVVFTAAMLACSKWLADVQGDSLAYRSILALAPSVFFVCVVSAYRGTFQGNANMTPTAVSQVVEAVGKIVVGLSLAYLLVDVRGMGAEFGAFGAIVGVTSGTAVSMVYMLIYKRRHNPARIRPAQDVPDPAGTIVRRFAALAVPITVSASIMTIVTFIDNTVVLNLLEHVHRQSVEAACSIYGIYNAVLTVINLPVSLMAAVSASMIPAISERIARRDRDGALETATSGLRLTSLVCLPSTVGLLLLATPILSVLYFNQPDIASGGSSLLMILAPVVAANSFVLVTNSILQAYGHASFSMVSMAFGGVIKIALDILLISKTQVTVFGVRIMSEPIMGAALGTLCCFLAIAALNTVYLLVKVRLRIPFYPVFGKPLLCSAVMGAGAWSVYGLVFRLAANLYLGLTATMAIALAAAMAAAVAIYVILVVMTRCVTRGDVAYLPRGDKIASAMHLK